MGKNLRSSSQTVNLVNLTPLCSSLNHIPKRDICISWRYLQDGDSHFPGQLVPMFDNLFREGNFTNIQSKPLLELLEAISFHPITCYLEEDTNAHPTTIFYFFLHWFKPKQICVLHFAVVWFLAEINVKSLESKYFYRTLHWSSVSNCKWCITEIRESCNLLYNLFLSLMIN